MKKVRGFGEARYLYVLAETRSDRRMVFGAADPVTGETKQFATFAEAYKWCRG